MSGGICVVNVKRFQSRRRLLANFLIRIIAVRRAGGELKRFNFEATRFSNDSTIQARRGETKFEAQEAPTIKKTFWKC
jgi:hypothetical protein